MWCFMPDLWLQGQVVGKASAGAFCPVTRVCLVSSIGSKLKKLEKKYAKFRAHLYPHCRAISVSKPCSALGVEKYLPICDHGRLPRMTNLALAALHPPISVCTCKNTEKTTDIEGLTSFSRYIKNQSKVWV